MLGCTKATSFINKRKNMKQPNLLMQVKRFDEARLGIPSEHVFALSMGLGSMVANTPSRFIYRTGYWAGRRRRTDWPLCKRTGRYFQKIARMLAIGRSVQGQNKKFKTANYF